MASAARTNGELVGGGGGVGGGRGVKGTSIL